MTSRPGLSWPPRADQKSEFSAPSPFRTSMLGTGRCTDHRCFDPVRDELARHYSVTAYDRRGYGKSGDKAGYSLDREVDDFVAAATVAGDGEPVSVLAYSYGATGVLRAVCTRPAPVRAVVTYEAPFSVPG
ncbi:MAG: alpha/beta fold hydrolase, partial [Thermocrispum sp.]